MTISLYKSPWAWFLCIAVFVFLGTSYLTSVHTEINHCGMTYYYGRMLPAPSPPNPSGYKLFSYSEGDLTIPSLSQPLILTDTSIPTLQPVSPPIPPTSVEQHLLFFLHGNAGSEWQARSIFARMRRLLGQSSAAIQSQPSAFRHAHILPHATTTTTATTSSTATTGGSGRREASVPVHASSRAGAQHRSQREDTHTATHTSAPMRVYGQNALFSLLDSLSRSPPALSGQINSQHTFRNNGDSGEKNTGKKVPGVRNLRYSSPVIRAGGRRTWKTLPATRSLPFFPSRDTFGDSGISRNIGNIYSQFADVPESLQNILSPLYSENSQVFPLSIQTSRKNLKFYSFSFREELSALKPVLFPQLVFALVSIYQRVDGVLREDNAYRHLRVQHEVLVEKSIENKQPFRIEEDRFLLPEQSLAGKKIQESKRIPKVHIHLLGHSMGSFLIEALSFLLASNDINITRSNNVTSISSISRSSPVWELLQALTVEDMNPVDISCSPYDPYLGTRSTISEISSNSFSEDEMKLCKFRKLLLFMKKYVVLGSVLELGKPESIPVNIGRNAIVSELSRKFRESVIHSHSSAGIWTPSTSSSPSSSSSPPTSAVHWRLALFPTLIDVHGGARDVLVPRLALHASARYLSVPAWALGATADHLCLVWCSQVAATTAKALLTRIALGDAVVTAASYDTKAVPDISVEESVPVSVPVSVAVEVMSLVPHRHPHRAMSVLPSTSVSTSTSASSTSTPNTSSARATNDNTNTTSVLSLSCEDILSSPYLAIAYPEVPSNPEDPEFPRNSNKSGNSVDYVSRHVVNLVSSIPIEVYSCEASMSFPEFHTKSGRIWKISGLQSFSQCSRIMTSSIHHPRLLIKGDHSASSLTPEMTVVSEKQEIPEIYNSSGKTHFPDRSIPLAPRSTGTFASFTRTECDSSPSSSISMSTSSPNHPSSSSSSTSSSKSHTSTPPSSSSTSPSRHAYLVVHIPPASNLALSRARHTSPAACAPVPPIWATIELQRFPQPYQHSQPQRYRHQDDLQQHAPTASSSALDSSPSSSSSSFTSCTSSSISYSNKHSQALHRRTLPTPLPFNLIRTQHSHHSDNCRVSPMNIAKLALKALPIPFSTLNFLKSGNLTIKIPEHPLSHAIGNNADVFFRVPLEIPDAEALPSVTSIVNPPSSSSSSSLVLLVPAQPILTLPPQPATLLSLDFPADMCTPHTVAVDTHTNSSTSAASNIDAVIATASTLCSSSRSVYPAVANARSPALLLWASLAHSHHAFLASHLSLAALALIAGLLSPILGYLPIFTPFFASTATITHINDTWIPPKPHKTPFFLTFMTILGFVLGILGFLVLDSSEYRHFTSFSENFSRQDALFDLDDSQVFLPASVSALLEALRLNVTQVQLIMDRLAQSFMSIVAVMHVTVPIPTISVMSIQRVLVSLSPILTFLHTFVYTPVTNGISIILLASNAVGVNCVFICWHALVFFTLGQVVSALIGVIGSGVRYVCCCRCIRRNKEHLD